MDTLLLSRIQFAANMSFHILFPTITIALCWFLVYFRMRHNAAKGTPAAQGWEEAYYLWTKIFALSFALGVVSGITMSFQFGTNWPGFMERAGNIAGPLLGYEVLTAFFLEATFLGIMLFGRDRVSDRVHLVATLMVAAGTTLSAFWILSLDSWMQTPTGYEIIDGRFHARRLAGRHLQSVVPVSAGAQIAGLDADRCLPDRRPVGLATAARRGQRRHTAGDAVSRRRRGGGDSAADLRRRPARTEHAGAPAGQDRRDRGDLANGEERTAHAVRLARREDGPHRVRDQVPKLASLILAHDADAELKGLNEFPNAHPPVAPVFWSFRVMVGMGLVMLAVSWWCAWALWRRRGGSVPAASMRCRCRGGNCGCSRR